MGQKPSLLSVGAGASLNTSALNKNFDTLATAIADAVDRNGTGESNNSMKGTLDMDGHRIQNVATPISPKDAVNVQYLSELGASGDFSLGILDISEVKTASAGQSIFTLSTITYEVGFNQLAVYFKAATDTAKGFRRLFKDIDYQETSSSSVTLLFSAAINDTVIFVINAPVATTDPSLVPASTTLLNAKDAAVAAKLAAEQAEVNAETAEIAAELAETNAKAARDVAITKAAEAATSAASISLPLPISSGGTGSNTAEGARTALGCTSSADVTTAIGVHNTASNAHGLNGTGKVQQVVKAESTSQYTITSVIPYDNTIPQSTEGTEVISLTVTPKLSNSIFIIETSALAFASSVATVFALFAGGANAIGAVLATSSAAFSVPNIIATYPNTDMTNKTFSLRAGPGAAGTAYVNAGGSGNQTFGTSSKIILMVTEVAV